MPGSRDRPTDLNRRFAENARRRGASTFFSRARPPQGGRGSCAPNAKTGLGAEGTFLTFSGWTCGKCYSSEACILRVESSAEFTADEARGSLELHFPRCKVYCSNLDGQTLAANLEIHQSGEEDEFLRRERRLRWCRAAETTHIGKRRRSPRTTKQSRIKSQCISFSRRGKGVGWMDSTTIRERRSFSKNRTRSV